MIEEVRINKMDFGAIDDRRTEISAQHRHYSELLGGILLLVANAGFSIEGSEGRRTSVSIDHLFIFVVVDVTQVLVGQLIPEGDLCNPTRT